MPDLRGMFADPDFNALPLHRRVKVLESAGVDQGLVSDYVKEKSAAAGAPTMGEGTSIPVADLGESPRVGNVSREYLAMDPNERAVYGAAVGARKGLENTAAWLGLGERPDVLPEERAGFGAEQMAEWFGAGEIKLAKALAKIPGLAKTPWVVRALATAAAEGAKGVGLARAQGQSGKAQAVAGALGAAGGAFAPVAGESLASGRGLVGEATPAAETAARAPRTPAKARRVRLSPETLRDVQAAMKASEPEAAAKIAAARREKVAAELSRYPLGPRPGRQALVTAPVEPRMEPASGVARYVPRGSHAEAMRLSTADRAARVHPDLPPPPAGNPQNRPGGSDEAARAATAQDVPAAAETVSTPAAAPARNLAAEQEALLAGRENPFALGETRAEAGQRLIDEMGHGERGNVDPDLLAAAGRTMGGAAVGAYEDRGHPVRGALIGAATGLAGPAITRAAGRATVSVGTATFNKALELIRSGAVAEGLRLLQVGAAGVGNQERRPNAHQ